MPDPAPQQQTREEIDTLLQRSIKRYENILTLFTAINSETGDNNPATLHARGMEILQLQEQAALADHTLIMTMQETNPAWLNHFSLLSKRQDIMHQILIHTHSLLSTTNNIKSLLAHEIKEIQGGRAALNGYQRQATPSQNGGILNDSR
ncbi:MAG: hypothetical protein Q7U64_11355 [Desulfocapsaceae bacterium]|jgi:hypothetical protein|nr:hypothetical protein [Desulfocapsaceae bacterium]